MHYLIIICNLVAFFHVFHVSDDAVIKTIKLTYIAYLLFSLLFTHSVELCWLAKIIELWLLLFIGGRKSRSMEAAAMNPTLKIKSFGWKRKVNPLN